MMAGRRSGPAYTQQTLLTAIQSVKEGRLSIREAARQHNIPYGTLGDKVRGRRRIIATPSFVLTNEEENELVSWLKELGARGFGRTRNDIKDCVKRGLDAKNAVTRFKNNRPGKQWMADFFQRHPEVTPRTPQALGTERAIVTREGLGKWFRDFKAYVDEIDPTVLSSPDRIYNADESGFCLCTKPKRVVTKKGSKHVYQVTANTKQQVTVLACCSAVGHYVPPLVIYPYKRMPDKNILQGFTDAHFQITSNGWITAPVFLTWLRDIFIPSVETKQKPVLLLVDGHSSHTSMTEILETCRDNGIILYCLKAHASHLIQPLDQAFFGSVKPRWEQCARDHLFTTGENVSLRSFAKVFYPAWQSAATSEVAVKGFSASGIFPFNPDKVLSSEKLKPSQTFTAVLPSSSSVSTSIETETASIDLSFDDTGPLHRPVAPQQTATVTSPMSAHVVAMKELVEKMFDLGQTTTLAFIDDYGLGHVNTHAEFGQFSNMLDGFCRLPHSVSASSPPCLTVQATASPQMASPCASTNTFLSPRLSLSIPTFQKSKTGNEKKTPSISMALSGNEFIEYLRKKEDDKAAAIQLKEKKKAEREEKKKERQEEKENLKRKREEQKEMRKKNKEVEIQVKKQKKEEKARLKLIKELVKNKRK